jgi:hypothetical protein
LQFAHCEDCLFDQHSIRKNGGGSIQAFEIRQGHKLLLSNKRIQPLDLKLPVELVGEAVSFVAPGSGERSLGTVTLAGDSLHLESGEVAVVTAR